MNKIFRCLTLLIAAVFGCIPVLPAQSQERQLADIGRLFSNDFLGDGQDRWHTTSYVVSVTPTAAADGDAFADFSGRLEHRLRSEVIAPANLATPSAGDRPYAGVLSYGIHSHAQVGDVQNRVGMDVVALGPQTGVGQLHSWVHDKLNTAGPDLTTQLPNAIYPTLSGEVTRLVPLGAIKLRPFAEAQYGVETYARVGADVFFSGRDMTGLRLRDVTTGQLYHASSKSKARHGFEFMLGADVAHVWSSEYLPASEGYVVEPVRFRGRAGVQLSAPQADMFYGVSWLSPEFEGQPSGQLVGSLNVSLRF